MSGYLPLEATAPILVAGHVTGRVQAGRRGRALDRAAVSEDPAYVAEVRGPGSCAFPEAHPAFVGPPEPVVLPPESRRTTTAPGGRRDGPTPPDPQRPGARGRPPADDSSSRRTESSTPPGVDTGLCS